MNSTSDNSIILKTTLQRSEASHLPRQKAIEIGA